ncbi:MAG: undecaprenyl-diphosphate phosphatase [Acidimicrobiales bacterium]|nr:undecaprenyl-diphosphate phosphatase [Acidimicrobiales bacterium]
MDRNDKLTAAGALALLVALAVAIAIARPASSPDDLSILASIILGVVEGLTEYLPISSTGHLLVTQELLGLGGTEQADLALDTYAICIQAGAILAVLVLYRRRIAQMIAGMFGRDAEGRRVLLATITAFVPTVAIALALQDPIRERLFGPGPIAIAWFVGGLGILYLVRTDRLNQTGASITEMTLRQAFLIGLIQCLALWPGVSRSLSTIVAAVLVGMSLSAAVEFSFILGLATLGAATIYEGLDNGQNLIDTYGITTPLIGLVVAFVSAVIAVRWMVTWLEQRGFAIFGWYRLVVGAALGVAVVAGAI